MSDMTDDPFSAAADPYPPASRRIALDTPAQPVACACGGPSMSRRGALLGLGALASLPMVASAEPFVVPCVQEKQRITPCRHKFCRHYAGEGDYHGR